MKYKSNNNVVYSCKYHVVWCPNYRRKVLVNGVEARLKELIEEICREYRIDMIEMEIMAEHVHLLMEEVESWNTVINSASTRIECRKNKYSGLSAAAGMYSTTISSCAKRYRNRTARG